MLIFPPPKSKSHRKKRPNPGGSPGPAPLNLIAASFDADGPEVYLTFDRAIDISALVLAQFTVKDGPGGRLFTGFDGAFLVDPTQVQVLLSITGSYSGEDQLLTVGAGNGIVAVDDGGTYAGVTDLVLPVP
jgi:hypothetical protein